MGKSIQLKSITNEKIYPHPYYPVGAIYLSVDNTNPTKWFGGTWSLIAQGRTLVGVDTNDTDFNTVKKTGGSKSVTLTVDQIPSHRHTNSVNIYYGIGGLGHTEQSQIMDNGNKEKSATQYTDYTGGGKSHTNLQPYYTCYIWCRTA